MYDEKNGVDMSLSGELKGIKRLELHKMVMIIVKKINNLLINIQEDSTIISNNALFIPYIALALQICCFQYF